MTESGGNGAEADPEERIQRVMIEIRCMIEGIPRGKINQWAGIQLKSSESSVWCACTRVLVDGKKLTWNIRLGQVVYFRLVTSSERSFGGDFIGPSGMVASGLNMMFYEAQLG